MEESILATSLTALMSFGVMLGTSLQAAAVEGFSKQPAGLLNSASEPDNARPDNEAGGQPGGSSWNPTWIEPRLGKAAASAGTKVEAANATSSIESVAAPISGRVVFAAPFKSYGFLLIIAHHEYHTVLWGFTKLEVTVDDLVAEGQTVGFIGGEGRTPSILHVEIRRNGHPIDHRVVTEGISPEQAVDDAIARIKQIPERVAVGPHRGGYRERDSVRNRILMLDLAPPSAPMPAGDHATQLLERPLELLRAGD